MVTHLVAQGFGIESIAVRLGLNPKTAASHQQQFGLISGG